jgi:hypothetical protein
VLGSDYGSVMMLVLYWHAVCNSRINEGHRCR